MNSQNERLKREIEHGQYLARRNPGGIWNWESAAGRIRWERRVKMLSSHIVPGMKVLEIGCGAGHFTQEFAQKGAYITAIDVSPFWANSCV